MYPGLIVSSESQNFVKKVTMSFTTELVRVKDYDVSSGGDVVLTFNWGYWYTVTENGLLNNN